MTKATLAQAESILTLVHQKGVSADQIRDIMRSGLLADLLDGDIARTNRDEFREILGLKTLGANTKHISIIGSVTLKPAKAKENSLKELVKAGKYDWVNNDITPDRFTDEVIGPIDQETELVLVKSSRNTTSEEMLAYGTANDLVPCSLGDILRLGIQHTELQKQVPYVGLHKPVPRPGGYRSVLALWIDADGCGLNLFWFDCGWDSGYVFVFVRPKPKPAPTGGIGFEFNA